MLVDQSELSLIAVAEIALSRASWDVGAAAAQWIARYSHGRTDADFGEIIGTTGEQVFIRRRAWETFADVYKDYENLRFSHFAAAIEWKEAAECLDWANRLNATVAEMKAWHRAKYSESSEVSR